MHYRRKDLRDVGDRIEHRGTPILQLFVFSWEEEVHVTIHEHLAVVVVLTLSSKINRFSKIFQNDIYLQQTTPDNNIHIQHVPWASKKMMAIYINNHRLMKLDSHDLTHVRLQVPLINNSWERP